MKTGLAALAMAGVAGGAALVTVPSMAAEAPPSFHDPAVSWAPCGSQGPQGAECGTISVPLDHSRPDGTRIQLALSRIRHRPGVPYQGIMVTNPGGPGAAGRHTVRLAERVPRGGGDGYDWIGFDPRGVGASVPALRCSADYLKAPRQDYTPRTRADEEAWRERSRGYARDCGAAGGELLHHMRTEDVARDIELIRAALGEPAINYYGFSYGTYLGQVYATLFPRRVRRMVLDSNVDPARVWHRFATGQLAGFERNMRAWWAWIAERDDVYHLGTTRKAVESAWYARKDRLRETPLGDLGPTEWTDLFLYAAYSRSDWGFLAGLWVDLAGGGEPLPGSADDNTFAVNNAVTCTDAPWPADWNAWMRENRRLQREAPFYTWGSAWSTAPCLFWPAKAGPAVEVDGRTVAPILLVGETLDAPTPFAGSLEVRRRFPASRLIAVPGGRSHANSLTGGACVDDRVAAYLSRGDLPERRAGGGPDATCEPGPAAAVSHRAGRSLPGHRYASAGTVAPRNHAAKKSVSSRPVTCSANASNSGQPA
ncbi:peptidase [Actinoplanes sp. NBRC 14428]|nr:peptidase [Actinoplanes sp. NBRC 14428]